MRALLGHRHLVEQPPEHEVPDKVHHLQRAKQQAGLPVELQVGAEGAHAQVLPHVEAAVAEPKALDVASGKVGACRLRKLLHALGARRGGDFARAVEDTRDDEVPEEPVDAVVRPDHEVGEEGNLDEEEALGALEPAIVEDLEQIHHDVAHVVKVQHDRADAHVVVPVGEGDESDRDDVMDVHHHVVLVPLLDEAVEEASVDPDPHL
mmetsp:Transcript_36226/g.62230  ORF Transcript_36226/g.62230 Transcript_36226/m.62230 type:complete len:207 (+) Transcript_36226:527-1147(+)